MTRKPASLFNAASVIVGTCEIPTCRNVHISLVDAGDVVHAQAVLGCEQIEDFVRDLRITRDRIVLGGALKGIQ